MTFDSTIAAFVSELQKIAEAKSYDERLTRHFAQFPFEDRWDRFIRNVRHKGFLEALKQNPKADEKLIQHAQSMHDLHHADTISTVPSQTTAGKTYDLRDLFPASKGRRYGCTCNDWRYRGSVDPVGHECKHIKAFRRGEVKA